MPSLLLYFLYNNKRGHYIHNIIITFIISLKKIQNNFLCDDLTHLKNDIFVFSIKNYPRNVQFVSYFIEN